jgi:hypothetical protein
MAGRDQVPGSVVEPVMVEVISDQIDTPGDFAMTPVAWMRSIADGLEEHETMLKDLTGWRRERMALVARHLPISTRRDVAGRLRLDVPRIPVASDAETM